MMDVFKIYRESARVNYAYNGKVDFGRWKPLLFPHWPVYRLVLDLLGANGFYMEPDKKVDEIIRQGHYRGRYNGLEFKSQIYPAGFRIEFFQNIVFENRNGGEYDFDRYKKMPYLIKLEFRKITNKIRALLLKQGLEESPLDTMEYKLATDRVKAYYVDSCHYPQKDMNFELSDVDGQTCEYASNGIDRDGKTIRNGDIKYYRDRWDGSLRRGKVYMNLNMNWWVIENQTALRNVFNYELFDATPDDFKVRRKRPDTSPQEYKIRRQALSESSARELQNELRRRMKAQSI